MEGWRPGKLGWREKSCPTKKQTNPLDSDRPSQGRRITLRRKSRLNPFGINRPWKCGFHLHGWAAGLWELKTAVIECRGNQAFLINPSAQLRVCLPEVDLVLNGRAFRCKVHGHRQPRGARPRGALLRDFETFGMTSMLPSVAATRARRVLASPVRGSAESSAAAAAGSGKDQRKRLRLRSASSVG